MHYIPESHMYLMENNNYHIVEKTEALDDRTFMATLTEGESILHTVCGKDLVFYHRNYADYPYHSDACDACYTISGILFTSTDYAKHYLKQATTKDIPVLQTALEKLKKSNRPKATLTKMITSRIRVLEKEKAEA